LTDPPAGGRWGTSGAATLPFLTRTLGLGHLAAIARRYTRAGAPVLVVPNAIAAAPYVRARQWAPSRSAGSPVVLGWAGSVRLAADFLDTGLEEAWARLA
jgi:hypothetical protein